MLQDDKIKERKNAIKYFPYLFDNGHHLIGDELDDVRFDLDFEFNRYEENHFSSFYYVSPRKECLRREEEITRGYNFIKELIEDEENFKIINEDLVKVLNQYYSLCDEIGKYKFIPHFKGSSGYDQNKANDEILYDLVLFEGYIKGVLKGVDDYIINNSDSSNLIMDKIHSLIDENALKFQELRSARKKYHSTWNGACKSDIYDYRELGEAKRNYRKTKNKACKQVLDMVSKLREIDHSVDFYAMKNGESVNEFLDRIYSKENNNQKYYEAIININKGPYYYSFLDQDEIRNQSIENKGCKRRNKKNN